MRDAVCRSVLPVYIERAVRSTAVFLQFCFSLWRSYCLPWCTWRIVVFIFRGFPNKDCDGETTCVPACFRANWSGQLSESRSPRRPTLDQLFVGERAHTVGNRFDYSVPTNRRQTNATRVPPRDVKEKEVSKAQATAGTYIERDGKP